MATTEEQRGYARGYAAGKRLADRNYQRELSEAAREDFVQRMMIAIAPQIIATPWRRKVGGEWKTDSGAKEIMATVRHIALEAAKDCVFMVPPVKPDEPAK